MPSAVLTPRRAEVCRLLGLAVVAGWLLHPFATGRLIGSGDALWYGNILADFVTQLRAGFFPIFVGQTAFAFNGAVYPLRVAPFYQHLAGFLDLCTGHSLGFFALQHLCVVVCGVAGLFGCYFTLSTLAPQRRWEAAGWAILYLSCPGVLALVYTQDLYMSWMAVPFIPLVVYGIIRTFQIDDLISQVWFAAPLAALWWVHSPIALWAFAIAALTQIGRLVFLHRRFSSWLRAFCGAGVFLLLAQYPFISVHEINTPGTVSAVDGPLSNPEYIVKNIHSVFPAILRPLSRGASALSDLQLGYALWATLLIAAFAVTVMEKGPDRLILCLLLICAISLLILLLPVPPADWTWAHLPQIVKRITYYWPMQRFYVILAGLIPAAGQMVLSLWPVRSRSAIWFMVGLGLACAWSLEQAQQFITAGHERTRAAEASARVQRPENLLLMNHSYGLFSELPPYFSNGVVDPDAEVRLLSADGKMSLGSEAHRALLQSGHFSGVIDANPGILDLRPTLHLSPGHHYRLALSFGPGAYIGVLQVNGGSFFREYVLPSSGQSLAFGSAPENSHILSVWTTNRAGEDINLRFIPTAAGSRPAAFADFASFTLSEDDPGSAPVRILSLMPFQAAVHPDGNGLLETPRMFTPGYRATVDGHLVDARPSPAGLVAVPVSPTDRYVELEFVGSSTLRISYALAWIAWSMVIAGAILRSAGWLKSFVIQT